jgi:hypothetical protein
MTLSLFLRKGSIIFYKFHLRDDFINEMVNRYIIKHPLDSDGLAHVKMFRLEVFAVNDGSKRDDNASTGRSHVADTDHMSERLQRGNILTAQLLFASRDSYFL